MQKNKAKIAVLVSGGGTNLQAIIDAIVNDFEELINDIKSIYISNNYLGLMSWLIDRAFCITPSIKQNKCQIKNNTNKTGG